MHGDYKNAFDQTKQLINQGRSRLINEAVNKLVKNSIRNTMEYAYELWSRGEQNIVKDHFPIQFRMLLDENKVKLIFHRDNLAMKLGAAVDGSGDRIAYGDSEDKTSDKVSWKFVPLAEDNRVYFKIANVKNHQYLKLGVQEDGSGEHNVYGASETDTPRHQFYLQPSNLNGEVVFYIFNREYHQALKLGRAIDSMGDRQVYSHKGSVVGSPELWAWYVLAW
ncbi:hypothetical protein O3G_MSEX007206 [Manduca sexta]|uniref:Microvitellogenin n=1 Tax=Manduca sexta TaxID=7130 RepID=A0A922CN57_MANSE|nr:hypothetical protein O3G_MSEX007206 [Manduca sexta]